MIYDPDRLKKIERNIKRRRRISPYMEGVYRIKHPILMLIRPKIVLRFNRKGNRIKGYLRYMRFKKKLTTVRMSGKDLVLRFNVDIIELDLVIHFYTRDAFEGFLDTPIGHLRFTGAYVKGLSGEIE